MIAKKSPLIVFSIFARLPWGVIALGMLVLPAMAERGPELVAKYCFSCHDEWEQKGDLQFDNLNTLKPQARLDILNKMQEQLFIEEMPTRKAKKQPSEVERAEMIKWLSAELAKHNASKLEDKLRKPEYGNFIDHEKLFSGKYADQKAFTPDRRWLISEFIFDAKFNKLLNHSSNKTIDGKRQSVIGDNNRRVNLTNPFLLPTNTGVRYYANTTLDGGHLLTMITNAKEAADNMIYLTRRDQRYLPSAAALMKQEWDHEKILESRRGFLNTHIERILKDFYGDQHKALLPRFVPVEAKEIVLAEGAKKAPFHAANPGREELMVIFRSMRRLEEEGDSLEELLNKCQREWFNFGDNERKIQARVTFMMNYMEEWRQQIEQHKYHDRNKPHVYKPRDAAEMAIISETINKHRQKGDRFNVIIEKCMADWEEGFRKEREAAGAPNAEGVKGLVEELFVKTFERLPSPEEAQKYESLAGTFVKSLGRLPAIVKLIQTLILRSEFVYRGEFGQGEPDEHGRKMLSPRDASYAISYALTDSSPDAELVKAAKEGRLNTREDYQREVERLLANRDQFYVIDEGVQRLQHTASITNTPIRKLRFFREFFGYQKLLPVFKDNKRFGGDYDGAKGRLVGEADRLVDHIISKDQNVFEELLGTEKFYVFHSGNNEAMTAFSERIGKIYHYFKDLDWKNFEDKDLLKHKEFLAEVNMRGVDVKNLGQKGRRNSIREFKTAMESFTLRFDKGQTAAAPFVSFPAHGKYNADTRTGMQLRSPEVAKFFNIKLDHWNYPGVQPATVAHRKGMLTHPAWLIAHSQNTETDPVIRGKWIREKLLAGTIPDIPITVEAVIPEDHHKTLRSRLAKVTEVDYCWRCHERMNPLGYALEMYDDFGRYRAEESLEHPDNLIKKGPDKAKPHVDLRDTYKTLPVDAKGALSGTGDKSLDGEVKDGLDLAGRLVKSDRVRQSIIRYAFRYFMGRNEFLSDSKTLIDAEQAYLKSEGSFDAVILSLLTSDSFLYRKSLSQNTSHE